MSIALIGAGRIAIEHVRVLHALKRKVSIACSKSERSIRWKKFKKIEKKVSFEKNIKNILKNPKIEFIISCLPWDINYKYIDLYIASNKKILMEKPIALKSSQINHLKNFYGNFLSIAFNRRFYETVDLLKKRISVAYRGKS